MPGRGRTVLRDYAADEEPAAERGALLGPRTADVFLNTEAFWRNIPEAVLGVHDRRLPGSEKMALLPRTAAPRPCAHAG